LATLRGALISFFNMTYPMCLLTNSATRGMAVVMCFVAAGRSFL